MLSDIFANSRARGKASRDSKGIVLQAHPLDMTAPGRRPSAGEMPVAKPQSLSEAAAEPAMLALPELAVCSPSVKKACLDSIFNEIIGDEPRFADHIENLL